MGAGGVFIFAVDWLPNEKLEMLNKMALPMNLFPIVGV